MKKVHQILFDFDYTLADSSEGIIASINYALQKKGYSPADPDAVRKMIGHSLEDAFGRFVDPADTVTIQECKRLFMDFADTGEMLKRTFILDGVEESLKNLYENFYTLGIVSTKRRSTIEETLTRFELEDYFDVIIGYEDVHQLKPDPEGLLKAIDYLAGDASDSLYVGDSLVDVETARRAGVRMIAVSTGVTDPEQLRSAGADHVIADLRALPGLLNVNESAL